MLGVYAKQWVEPVAAALLANRAISAWVVHGDGGLDEISTTGPTFVASIKGGNLTSFEINPEDAGVPRATLADLKGGDPIYNAGRLRALLEGMRDPYRDVVLMNAAAAFIVAGRADTLKLGADLAAQEIDSGRARQALDKLVKVSNA
jgi:anthranilate phosphoribosyltransferase